MISISETGEDIAKLQGVSSDLITLEDFFPAIPDPQIITGDETDNVLVGGMSGDTISTGSGNDIVNEL